jgi:flagellar biosynthesis protein FliQ
MPQTALLEQAAQLVLTLSAPLLGAGFAAAVVGSLAFGLARLDDPLLRALPRLVVGWLVLLASAAFVGSGLASFAREAYGSLGGLTR